MFRYRIPIMSFGIGIMLSVNIFYVPLLSQTLTSWFSEEQGEAVCPSMFAVTGVECGGRYCDNKKLHCGRLEQSRSNKLEWGRRFSEERPNRSFSENSVVKGISCSGRYCDNLSLLFLNSKDITIHHCDWSRNRFSEEQRAGHCEVGKFVAGIECSGKYCDNLRLFCCSVSQN